MRSVNSTNENLPAGLTDFLKFDSLLFLFYVCFCLCLDTSYFTSKLGRVYESVNLCVAHRPTDFSVERRRHCLWLGLCIGIKVQTHRSRLPCRTPQNPPTLYKYPYKKYEPVLLPSRFTSSWRAESTDSWVRLLCTRISTVACSQSTSHWWALLAVIINLFKVLQCAHVNVQCCAFLGSNRFISSQLRFGFISSIAGANRPALWRTFVHKKTTSDPHSSTSKEIHSRCCCSVRN